MTRRLYIVILDEPADPPPVVLGVHDTLDQAYARCHEYWEDLLGFGLDNELEFRPLEPFCGLLREMADPQDGETVFIIQEVEVSS